jgi:antitoxin component of MazEF toxin-antitoxin module
MSETFKTRLRKIGTSLGVIIPKDVLEREGAKEGEEVRMSIVDNRKVEAIDKLFGIAKGTKPFKRDRIDRLERY